MATRNISMTMTYVAWDTSNNQGKTGDVANHTLRWVKDGSSSAPTNSASEVDAANAPGIYKLTLTAAETDADIGTLCGKSSSTNVSIMPVTIQFERLPNAAPGTSGGLPLGDTAGGVAVASLSAAAIDAIWDEPQSGHTTVDTFGFYLDAAISGISGSAGSGSGSASVGNYLADLISTRDNIAAQLADMTVNPKPSYQVDGQKVAWDTHFKALTTKLERVNLAIQAAEPFETHSTGYTQ